MKIVQQNYLIILVLLAFGEKLVPSIYEQTPSTQRDYHKLNFKKLKKKKLSSEIPNN